MTVTPISYESGVMMVDCGDGNVHGLSTVVIKEKQVLENDEGEFVEFEFDNVVKISDLLNDADRLSEGLRRYNADYNRGMESVREVEMSKEVELMLGKAIEE